jgi:hypothetical protein
VKIVEAVDRSARDAERVTGADFDFAAFEREGDDAFDAVDGLLVGGVTVGAMGTFAPAGMSASKMATEPPESLPSTKKRIANCPILISSCVPVP